MVGEVITPVSLAMEVCLHCVAVAFGYFENLLNLQNPMQVHHELMRIKAMNALLDQTGQEEHLYEIFVDATEEVFNQITTAIQNGIRDETFLVNAFNEEYNSNAIITHFRVSDPCSAAIFFPHIDRGCGVLRLTC